MSQGRLKIPKVVKELLIESNKDYHFELGTKHIKIFVENKMCAILPRGRCVDGYHMQNVLAQIRRAIRGQYAHEYQELKQTTTQGDKVSKT